VGGTALPGLERLNARDALATLEALFDSAKSYVIYRVRKVPADDNVFGAEVEFVSPSIRTMLGVTDPETFSSWFLGIHPDDMPRVMTSQMRCLEEGTQFDEVFRMHVDGDLRHVHAISTPTFDDDGEVTHFNGLGVDVTERVHAELEAERLRHQVDASQRWEAIGALAASVAHDFNNLLQAILVTASLAADDDRVPNDARELMQEVVGEVERGAALTRDLLGYAQGRDEGPRTCPVNGAVARVARILDRLFVGVTVTRELAPEVEALPIDEGELEQVLMNLGVNAAHATEKRGEVQLRTALLSAGQATALVGSPISDAMVAISVRDDGVGIAPEQLGSIFDSFFTTKPKGTGTGLGLTTAKRIVERWAGVVHVESAPGEGSTFTVLLPSAEAHAAATAAVTDVRALAEGSRVLLVDDEQQLRRALARHLRRRGFRVSAAASYDEALAHLGRSPHDLVITDTVMPGRGGLELVRHLRRSQPEVPIVVMSGHADDATIQQMLAAGNAEFLQKPFGLGVLDETIASLAT